MCHLRPRMMSAAELLHKIEEAVPIMTQPLFSDYVQCLLYKNFLSVDDI